LGTAATPWREIFSINHTIVWMGMLAFLGWHTARRSLA